MTVALAEADENGHAVGGAVFSWSSSNAGRPVDDTGLGGGRRGDSQDQVRRATHATDGPNWIDNTNWLSDAPLGEWYGVETDGSGRVVRLSLPNNRLVGIIPSDLGHLAELTHLNFWENQLWGTLPPELGRLANLRSA